MCDKSDLLRSGAIGRRLFVPVCPCHKDLGDNIPLPAHQTGTLRNEGQKDNMVESVHKKQAS